MAKSYYVIKVDYFVYDETKENNIGKKPMYLYTSRDKLKIFVFDETMNKEGFDLKWFETKAEAKKYIKDRPSFKESMCFDNVRIEEVIHPFAR